MELSSHQIHWLDPALKLDFGKILRKESFSVLLFKDAYLVLR